MFNMSKKKFMKDNQDTYKPPLDMSGDSIIVVKLLNVSNYIKSFNYIINKFEDRPLDKNQKLFYYINMTDLYFELGCLVDNKLAIMSILNFFSSNREIKWVISNEMNIESNVLRILFKANINDLKYDKLTNVNKIGLNIINQIKKEIVLLEQEYLDYIDFGNESCYSVFTEYEDIAGMNYGNRFNNHIIPENKNFMFLLEPDNDVIHTRVIKNKEDFLIMDIKTLVSPPVMVFNRSNFDTSFIHTFNVNIDTWNIDNYEVIKIDDIEDLALELMNCEKSICTEEMKKQLDKFYGVDIFNFVKFKKHTRNAFIEVPNYDNIEE